jgi:chorismate synthase
LFGADDDDPAGAGHRGDRAVEQAPAADVQLWFGRAAEPRRGAAGQDDRVIHGFDANRLLRFWNNSRVLRWITAGESHGPALVAVLDGLPAGVAVTTADLVRDLARRRLGYGRGARMKFEQDEVELTGGVRHGRTMGGPVAVRIANTEWPKWATVMSADPVDPHVLAEQARNAPLTRPRPGHADLAGMQKYDVDDARPILERASARETAARVGLGAVAKAFLEQSLGIRVVSHVVAIGAVTAPEGLLPGPADADAIDGSEVRCFDPPTASAMIAEIDEARAAGDTLGGVVEVLAYGLPPGLGSHTSGDRRLDARLAGALMGIQAIKGVEVGDGFGLAALRGSQAHDEIDVSDGVVRRTSGRSGGTEGGMSTGEVLRVRAAMKPISTVPRALRTIDTATGEAAVANNQRSDVVAVPAAGVVAEAMVALVLAEAVLEKFGGDSLDETRRNAAGYLGRLTARGLSPVDEVRAP